MPKRLIVAVLSLLLLAPPAQAQWSYSPFSGRATWLSIARTLQYPLNRLSGVSAPFYLANNIVWSGSYLAGQRVYGRQNSAAVQDQISHLKQYGYGSNQRSGVAYTNQADPALEQVPIPQPAGEWSGPDPTGNPQMPVPLAAPALPPSIQNAPPTVAPSQDAMPPIAPSVTRRPTGAGSPLALGFIHVVNDRFGGDIGSALSDKDTAKYAQAVGLVDQHKIPTISADKKDLIRAILADEKESADVRITAVRVLLKH